MKVVPGARRILIHAAMTASLLVLLGPAGKQPLPPSVHATAPPATYDPTATPWLDTPLDAQEIAQHYARRAYPGLAQDSWPLLVATCSPTIYAHWDGLSSEERVAATERQGLCKKTLSAKHRRDLEMVLDQAGKFLSYKHPNPETQVRYQTALGLSADDVLRIRQGLEAPERKRVTVEEASSWIARQVQRQSKIGTSLWTRGRVIGPYSPSSPWGSEVNISPEQALERLEQIVRARGLLAVRLPLGWAQSPSDWLEIGNRLDRVAGLIEKRTRLGDGSFGLWGRVMLDWRVADRAEANAVTLRAGQFYSIQAPETAVGHEWFHAYSHWLRSKGYEDLQEKLLLDLRNVKYNRWQMKEIFRQSRQVLSKEQAAQQWIDTLQDLGPAKAWDFPGNAPFQVETHQHPSLYWYAQAAWTLAPRLNPGETPWISRRRALDETLQASGWTGRGIIKPGYYTEDDELVASAFQGDINLDMVEVKLLDSALPNSLVGNPLPVESQAMRNAFSRMFWANEKRRPAEGWDQTAGTTASRRAAKG